MSNSARNFVISFNCIFMLLACASSMIGFVNDDDFCAMINLSAAQVFLSPTTTIPYSVLEVSFVCIQFFCLEIVLLACNANYSDVWKKSVLKTKFVFVAFTGALYVHLSTVFFSIIQSHIFFCAFDY